MNDQSSKFPAGDRDQELARLREDFIDSWDEELEMETDDDRLGSAHGVEGGSTLPRRIYFRELFRLQGRGIALRFPLTAESAIARLGRNRVDPWACETALGECVGSVCGSLGRT